MHDLILRVVPMAERRAAALSIFRVLFSCFMACGLLSACAPAAVTPAGCPTCPACRGSGCAACPPPVACDCAGARVHPLPPGPRTHEGIARTEAQLLARYEGRPATQVLEGKATYYGSQFDGRTTANGDVYDPNQFTAAHRKLPFNTVVRVIRKDTNRYVYVRINDRGPFAGKSRIIDLSRIAAERLDMIRAGVVPVRVEVLD